MEEVLQFQNSRIAATKVTATVQNRVQPFLDALPTNPVCIKCLAPMATCSHRQGEILRDRVRSYFQGARNYPENRQNGALRVFDYVGGDRFRTLGARSSRNQALISRRLIQRTEVTALSFLHVYVQDTFRALWCNAIEPDRRRVFYPISQWRHGTGNRRNDSEEFSITPLQGAARAE